MMSVDLYDMDNKQHIRHNSESSNTSTSGYSTMSPGGGDYGNLSPSSSTVSMSSAGSPRTAALQTDFSNLNLPNSSPSSNALLYQHNYLQQQQQTALSELSYRHMSTTAATTVEASTAAAVTHAGLNYPKQNYTNLTNLNESATFMPNYTLNLQNIYGTGQPMDITQSTARNMVNKKVFLPARLQITEQPVDKFRFRYKSEMHGTHGSLTSSTSNRTLKRYPEVVLKDYNGPAKIRCSLFQANLDSPHSHQLVVRRDDIDICDPHELDVGPEQGFVAQFQNMGIIHTAKKYITNELLDKKIKRLRSQLGGCEISERQRQELYKETEKEAKAMNLNQVRLCFEAFREEPDKTLTPIAPAVYTNPINNRKSAQTGELRIVRLSIATGSAGGKDELILLVEKVSKKNIKVRFYELNDDELIWESYGTFRESDVHHQYAIVCQTPPYKDKQIEKPVDVFIELVRPSDDERSCPLPFRYKPLDTVISRKRRRTCSSANSSGNSSNNSFSSIELPETVTEQQQAAHMMQCGGGLASRNDLTISEEYNTIRNMLLPDSEELAKLCPQDFSFDENLLQNDGASSSDNLTKIERQKSLVARAMNMQNTQTGNVYLKRIFGIHEKLYKQGKKPTAAQLEEARLAVTAIYREHAERSNHSETLIHEIINDDDFKGCIMLFQILNQLKIADLLNVFLNGDNQSGLHCASFKNDNKYIHALLSLGCDPNIQDKDGNTAVHIAILRQNPKCIESFLKFPYKNAALKIDLTKKNYDDLTPLHLAIKHDQTATAKRLLQFDGSAASVCNSKDGNNALHMAILKENKDVVEAIKSARNIGDTLVMRNNAGLRPIDLAKQIQGSSGIYDTLEPLYMDMDDQNDEHQMIRIKEEQDMSSTSASDDEDLTTNEQFTVDRIKIENEGDIEEEVVDPIAVKTESDLHVNDDDSQRVKTLKSFLNDSRNYQKLAQRLNVGNRWKKLATMSLMSHLVCLWCSAEDMLDYIKNKDYNIEFSAFAEAVAEDLQSITER